MRYLKIIVFIIILAGCATPRLQPLSKDTELEEDERRLWTRAQEEQKVLDTGGLLYRDTDLESYVNSIARKLQPRETLSRVEIKVKIIKNPYLNAFAYPNGVIYIHTGILARMDNEAQLATLIGHEMTHVIHRHTIASYKSIKNKSAVLATLNETIGIVPIAGAIASQIGTLGAMAAVTGHSREQEREADIKAIELIVKAGYDPRESPKLFLHLKHELEEENLKEPFFFGTHPRLKERIESYEEIIKEKYMDKKGITNKDVFIRKITKLILDNAQLDISAGRFNIAKKGIEKYLSIRPNDPKAYFLFGEIYRQRDEKDDLNRAKEMYEKALSINDSYPDAHKGLGFVYLKLGNKGAAKKHLTRYIQLSPNASDRSYIEEYLK